MSETAREDGILVADARYALAAVADPVVLSCVELPDHLMATSSSSMPYQWDSISRICIENLQSVMSRSPSTNRR